jgi:DNA polymerase-3 subunit alpha
MFDDVIVPFSGYGFNRSHAVCYSRIAYETAYLRANFPVEFMTALMTTDRNNTERVVLEMRECEDMGITVLPPDINQSDANFTVVENPKSEGNNEDKKDDKENKQKFKTAIRFGLTAIKGLGEDTTEKIMEERQKEKYADISDFVSRVPAKLINKKTLEALTYSGSLDAFGSRGDLNASIEPLSKFAKTTQEKANSGQVGLFGGIDEAESSTKFALTPGKADKAQILMWEKQVMGLYISGHPLKPWHDYFEKNGTLINQIKEDMDKQEITIHGQIIKRRRLRTRKGDAMAIIEIEDTTAPMEVPIFPRVYDKIDHRLLDSEKVVVLKGKVSVRDGEINVIGNSLSLCTGNAGSQAKTMVITLPQTTSKSVAESLKLYLKEKEAQEKSGQKIIISMGGKKVPVPFMVDISGDFVAEIESLSPSIEIS